MRRSTTTVQWLYLGEHRASPLLSCLRCLGPLLRGLRRHLARASAAAASPASLTSTAQGVCQHRLDTLA